MKKKLKISTLIIGIIVAIIAFSNSRSYAESFEVKVVSELKTLEAELLDVIEQILDEEITKMNDKKCMKFYNAKNQLVYECRDKDDERIKILLRRSSLVLQTDSSSYYKLD